MAVGPVREDDPVLRHEDDGPRVPPVGAGPEPGGDDVVDGGQGLVGEARLGGRTGT